MVFNRVLLKYQQRPTARVIVPEGVLPEWDCVAPCKGLVGWIGHHHGARPARRTLTRAGVQGAVLGGCCWKTPPSVHQLFG